LESIDKANQRLIVMDQSVFDWHRMTVSPETPKPKTRMQRVREALGLSQAAMARELRISQPLVCAIENGAAESGPLSKLLDIVEAQSLPAAASQTALQPAAGPSAGASDDAPAAFPGEAA
jgi:DNA-binding transcriptional regulator YiaG